VVKFLNQRWWIPVVRRNSNMTGDMYTCVSVTGNFTRAYAQFIYLFAQYHNKTSHNKTCMQDNKATSAALTGDSFFNLP